MLSKLIIIYKYYLYNFFQGEERSKKNLRTVSRPRPKWAGGRLETATDIKSRLEPEGGYGKEKIILKNVHDKYKISQFCLNSKKRIPEAMHDYI
jgi:hypothetical protein